MERTSSALSSITYATLHRSALQCTRLARTRAPARHGLPRADAHRRRPDVSGRAAPRHDVQHRLQLADVDARLPGWARVGVGPADGREAGEFSAIFYRTERLELLETGTFWLLPTPEVAGSKSWDAAIERIATWTRFRDRRTGCRVLHLNTRFDPIGEQARQESARPIRRRLSTLASGLPVILTVYFNTTPSSVAYRIFTRDTIVDASPPLTDALVTSRTRHYGPTSSWTEFKAIQPGRRIDYVMVSAGIDVLAHGILPDRWDGRVPSDHMPMLATLSPACR